MKGTLQSLCSSERFGLDLYMSILSIGTKELDGKKVA
jgi:hypothetical protein